MKNICMILNTFFMYVFKVEYLVKIIPGQKSDFIETKTGKFTIILSDKSDLTHPFITDKAAVSALYRCFLDTVTSSHSSFALFSYKHEHFLLGCYGNTFFLLLNLIVP